LATGPKAASANQKTLLIKGRNEREPATRNARTKFIRAARSPFSLRSFLMRAGERTARALAQRKSRRIRETQHANGVPFHTTKAPCHIPMATQTGPALRLALAGVQRRVTALIPKAKEVGGLSSVVLCNHHREASQRSEKNCMSAKFLCVSLGLGIGRMHTAIVARNAASSLSQ
jgi:hypothetical protein